MARRFCRCVEHCPDEFPTSIFYAYKQQENEAGDGKTSTGWETMLTAIINVGFKISQYLADAYGTTESTQDRNQRLGIFGLLCSSVAHVPKTHSVYNPPRMRSYKHSKKTMPPALDKLTRIADIRPVDLAQAAIGPGMEIYSRYSKVMRVSGEIVPIREVLMHVNNEINAYHEKETGELDPESQFCLTWLQQHGYMEGNFRGCRGTFKSKGCRHRSYA